jgi:hypothetical protein
MAVQILGGNAKLVSSDVVLDNHNTMQMNVFPNPVSRDASMFRVRCSKCSGESGTIHVYDALGRVVASKEVRGGEMGGVTSFSTGSM